MKLLVATQNKGKVREYQRMLENLPEVEVVGLGDIGLGKMDVDETGTTFEENAILKATTYGASSKMLTLADDSGLAVDALDGRPGIYSARYGSPDLDDAGRRAKLLAEMAGVPDDERTARFVCVIAVYDPATDTTHTVEGTSEGFILHKDHDGGEGFGYDAIFQPAGLMKSFAQLSAEQKDRLSHRGQAASQLPDVLAKINPS